MQVTCRSHGGHMEVTSGHMEVICRSHEVTCSHMQVTCQSHARFHASLTALLALNFSYGFCPKLHISYMTTP